MVYCAAKWLLRRILLLLAARQMKLAGNLNCLTRFAIVIPAINLADVATSNTVTFAIGYSLDQEGSLISGEKIYSDIIKCFYFILI